MSTELSPRPYLELLERILVPIVRFCLKRRVLIHEFEVVARRAYLSVANEELRKSTEKVNASRLSVATGIYRSEVVRLLEETDLTSELEPQGILARVLSKWERDPKYSTRAGVPKQLEETGEGRTFQQLVAEVSKHINHASVLFELQRSGAVSRQENGLLTLLRGTEKLGEDEISAFNVLSRNYEALMNTVEANVSQRVIPSQMHYHTEFDNISPEHVITIKTWLIKQGQIFHRRMRAYLAQFDRDFSASLGEKKGEGKASVSVTSFSHSMVVDPGSQKEP